MNFDKTMNSIERFIDFLTPTVSLETFFSAVSEGIDEKIKENQQNGKRFLGGKVRFYLSSNQREICFKTEVYYEETGEYQKQEFSGEFLLDRIHECDRPKFNEMLDEAGFFTVEIEEP